MQSAVRGAAETGASRVARETRRVLWITLLLNLAVAAAKLLVGALTSTLSLVADGFHSLLDGTGNVVGLITIHVAHKPPDEDHHYGHRKFEVLASMGISIILFVTAAEILMESAKRLRAGGAPAASWITVATALATLAVNIFVARYEARRGAELRSPFLIADSRHTLSDVFATIGVLAAILLARAGLAWADPVAALGIAGVIVLAGYRILVSGLDVVADRSMIDPAAIEAVATAFPAVRSCRRVRTRGFVDAVYLDLTLLLDAHLSLREAHDLCDGIEAALRARFPQVADIVIHPEPDLAGRETAPQPAARRG